MKKDIDEIETQYNEHPYPLPIEDMVEKIASGYTQGSCPKYLWQRLFPEKKYKDDLNVLIAGCGTNQAIYHALKFPNAKHYAIDLSEKSLNHVNNMIKKHDIKNLIIEKKGIEELKNKNEFDYVVSTGVIHHTKNPQESLNILVNATKTDGALFIMVYATYLRVGIYYLQDAFRHLGLKSNANGIEIGKKLIQLSPKNHYANVYLNEIQNNTSGTKDLSFNAGFVDTFFNERDVSFDALELKKLISNSGAFFQSWEDNAHHYRKLFDFRELSELDIQLKTLNPYELTDFTQKMSPSLGKFSFTLRKQKKYMNKFFKTKDLIDTTYAYKLNMDHPLNKKHDYNSKGLIINHGRKIELDILEKIIWDQLNNNISSILIKTNKIISNLNIEKQISLNELKEILHNFWKNGYISLADV
jgi:SAM-dependent methyltransferase